jgi:hypothetical protein
MIRNNVDKEITTMTLKVKEMIEFLGENGIRVSPTLFSGYSEEVQLKVLNKMIRELVA